MYKVIRSGERFHFQNEWLSSYYSFSFADYYDPANLHFGPLRVFNDDIFQPGTGFPMHPHAEMEIVTYVIRGALEHTDSLGNRGRICARITAQPELTLSAAGGRAHFMLIDLP